MNYLPSLPGITICLISESQVTRIIGMSLQSQMRFLKIQIELCTIRWQQPPRAKSAGNTGCSGWSRLLCDVHRTRSSNDMSQNISPSLSNAEVHMLLQHIPQT
jgi:hypothetical protein